MRNDHLADLEEQHQKNVGESAAWQTTLKVHLDDVNSAWTDINENMRDIVENVDQQSFEICMKDYRQDVEIFSQKIDEYSEVMNPTTYQPRQLSQKVAVFE